jgi:VIT1/CCC1 family predicted Fe2+/Mn2+ transporter
MPVRHRERHRTEHTGWLRAAVLGANDGILSTASLVLGVAAGACDSQQRVGRGGRRPGRWGNVDGCG